MDKLSIIWVQHPLYTEDSIANLTSSSKQILNSIFEDKHWRVLTNMTFNIIDADKSNYIDKSEHANFILAMSELDDD